MRNQESRHDVLTSLERRGWDALSASDGASFYAGIMTDDAVMIFPGTVWTKEESLAAINDAPPWLDYRLEDIQVLPVGREGAVVTYRAIANRAGRPTYEAVMTSVYALRDGAWKLVLHQQSP